MAGKIKVLNRDLQVLGSTSKAFNIANKEELMREYTLQFSIVNVDSIYPHINENAVFMSEGQYFDICGITGDSGTTNITQVLTEHISYRLSEYTLPNGYAFVGTVAEIAADILQEAKTVEGVSADTVFTIGTVFETGTVSYALDGSNITARAALIGLSEFGVEISFDNFTVNIPKIRGEDNGLVFEYKRNYSGGRRTWQKGNGWSYECNIADLQRVPGHTGDKFTLGDYVTVFDSLVGTRIKERIISYTQCDDPSQNKVVIGVFVRDNADIAIETDRVARDVSNTALKQGEKYSNVSITHKDGFKATNLAETLRILANANDCFIVQAKQSDGTWKTIASTEIWGILSPRLTNIEAKDDYYGTIGQTDRGGLGFQLILKYNGGWRKHFEILSKEELRNENYFTLSTVLVSEGGMEFQAKDGDFDFTDKHGNSVGFSGSIHYMARENVSGTLKFKNGLLRSVD